MFQKRVAIIVCEKIEYSDLGRVFTRKQPDAQLCWVQSQLQSIEGLIGDDQLAVEDEPLNREVARGFDDFREVAAQRALPP